MRFKVILLISVLFLLGSSGFSADKKTTLRFEEQSQFEIVSPEGVRIFIDVSDPSHISSAPTADDILLTTHSHPDHYIPAFVDKFPGMKITFKPGQLKAKDVDINCIPSSHTRDITFDAKDESASDYIFVINIGGNLKIVHCGDIGQKVLTPEQIAVLKDADILMTQFDNPLSGMDLNNKKGFNLVKQINPKIIFPTHYIDEDIPYAKTLWNVMYSEKDMLEFGSSISNNKPVFIIAGFMAKLYKKQYNLPEY